MYWDPQTNRYYPSSAKEGPAKAKAAPVPVCQKRPRTGDVNESADARRRMRRSMAVTGSRRCVERHGV